MNDRTLGLVFLFSFIFGIFTIWLFLFFQIIENSLVVVGLMFLHAVGVMIFFQRLENKREGIRKEIKYPNSEEKREISENSKKDI